MRMIDRVEIGTGAVVVVGMGVLVQQLGTQWQWPPAMSLAIASGFGGLIFVWIGQRRRSR